MKTLEDKYWNKAPNNPETTLVFEKENKVYRSMTHIHSIGMMKHSTNTYSIDMIYAFARIREDGKASGITFALDRTGAILV